MAIRNYLDLGSFNVDAFWLGIHNRYCEIVHLHICNRNTVDTFEGRWYGGTETIQYRERDFGDIKSSVLLSLTNKDFCFCKN